MKLIRKIILKIIPPRIKDILGRMAVADYKMSLKYSTSSYAQEGEDLIIDRFLGHKEKGFYIDIGAHHPKRFSNTFRFYQRGWRGINIDAMPDSMTAFEIDRPNDINLELGISENKGEMTYYMFNEPALNTFSQTEANKKDGLGAFKIVGKKNVSTSPLLEVLDKYLGDDNHIDFMSIDVEGLDLEVVKSNDWEKYRPSLVLVEDLAQYSLLELPSESELYQLLIDNQYQLVAKTFNTLFFKDVRN